MLPKITSLLVLLTWIIAAKSQDLSLLGTGGEMTASGNLYLSYSIGEPCIQETQLASQWKTEGFQQPESIHLMVGIHETATSAHIRIFPNPASSTITISGIETDASFEIRLLNQLGQILFTHVYHPNEAPTLGIENLSPGLYLLNLRSNSTSIITQSIVKI